MSYSSGKIFEDSQVNALLDRLMYELLQASGLASLDDKICLTGRAASILQGGPVGECKNIILITADHSLFNVVWKQLPKSIDSQGSVFFKERTLFYFDKIYIEIWYTPDTVTSVAYSGIYLQQINKIPSILL